jgi:hypothetical protein
MDEVALTEEEKQATEVIQFCRSHRKELLPAEKWLDSIDEDMVEAWFLAERGSPRDWRKILFLEWLFRDKKLYENEIELGDFDAHDWCENERKQFSAHSARVRAYGPRRTERNPVFYVVQGALEEGKKAVQGEKPENLITIAVAIRNFNVSRITLLRKIKDGKIISHRPPNSKSSAKHIISAKDVAALYPLRK